YQGKGYAYQLMSMIADIEVPVFLEVRYSNIVAQKLYERCGFVVLGKRKNYYHDPIEDAIVMRKG
ncbi:GNAT family N-acetyltransferase, partial [Streptococcus agalactiae]|nr:GNAT family N-acetyltransferase [Streptococcus agalactiae]